MIAIDDIDTRTDKAYELLETIRCYLTHPKLVVLVSGDIKLYSYIVGVNKANEIKDKTISRPFEGNMLYQLEQQYIIKTLPIHQRIKLMNLHEINKENKYSIYLKTSMEPNKEELLVSFLKNELKKYLSIHDDYIGEINNFILSQPIRTIVQLIKYLLSNNDVSSFSMAIKDIFLSDLLKEKIGVNILENFPSSIVNIASNIFSVIYEHNDMDTGFYCRVEGNDSSYNIAKIFLSSLVSSYSKSNSRKEDSVSMAINSMLLLGSPANIYLYFVESENYTKYFDYIGLNNNSSTRNIMEKYSGIVSPKMKSHQGVLNGIIRLNRRGSNPGLKRKHLSSLERFSEHIPDNIIDYITKEAFLISSNRIRIHTETRDCVSIYAFLASIAELLECNEENELKDKLGRLSAFNTYSGFLPERYNIDDSNENDDGDNEDNESNNTQNNEYEDTLIKLLLSWRKDTKTLEFNYSSLCLGKIWARLFYSINNISDNAKREYKKRRLYTSEIFARFIWGVCNSILIEESRYSNNRSNDIFNIMTNASNVSTSIKHFINNLKSIKNVLNNDKNSRLEDKFKEYLPLTYSIVNCPLVYPFLYMTEDKMANEILEGILKIDENMKNHLDNLKLDKLDEYGLPPISKLAISKIAPVSFKYNEK
ncbi:hypothetical protein L4F91_05040 [Avibacterium sp. 20-126]|uniref:hypothetical protein n=1 Tax=Avibacterium sp. 20-126 TaxID=2911524 RepID=UPI0021895787|nr:hypothetical protein L4F91_05040 [Avibacterium sp. 20-126]